MKEIAISMSRIILLLLCSLSLILFFYFTYLLDIDRVSLKQGFFNISNNKYEFKLKELQHTTYNLILEFFTKGKDEYEKIRRSEDIKNNFWILTQLIDNEGNVIKSGKLISGDIISGGGSRESLYWDLFGFKAEKKGKYNLRIQLQSKDNFFDKIEKEIYLEEYYDYASLPWWVLFQRIFLILFITTLLLIILIYTRYWLKKRKSLGA